jgi:dolichyl-phosphate beta-glucosyltransferase
MPDSVYLSIIIPAYNEEKIIEKTLKKVLAFLSNKNYKWEVVVVDDGSIDATSKIVHKYKEKKVSVYQLRRNQGKGAALREGVKKAKGEYVVYSDADLSVSIENVDKFIEILKKGNDVVIASRRIRGSEIKVHQPFIRETMGRVFTLITRVILALNITDFTCGFKGFRKKAAKEVFLKGVINRWAYDSEVLYLAKKFGYKIVQVPISWENREDTKVDLAFVVFESLKDLISIRLNDIFGVYDRKV